MSDQIVLADHTRKLQHSSGLGSKLVSVPLMLYLLSVPLMSRMPIGAEVSQLLGGVAALAFAAYVLLARVSIRLPLELILFGVFIVYSFTGGLFAVDLPAFITRQFTFVQLWILALVMFNAITAEPFGHERALRIVQISSVAAAFASLIGYDTHSGRLAGTLGNANTYGLTMLVGISTTLLASNSRWFIGHLLRLGTLAFLTSQVFLSGSRKAILGALMMLGIYGVQLVVRNARRPIEVSVLVVSLLIASIGVITWAQNSQYWRRVENLFLYLQGETVSEGSLYQRADLIAAGLKLWKEHPYFGVGTGQFRYYAHRYGIRETYSHSNPVEVLANFGLIGALLYYSIYATLTWRIALAALRNWRFRENRYRLCLLAGFWLVWLMLESAWVSYYSKIHWIVLVLVLIFSWNLSRSRASAMADCPNSVW